MKIAVLVSGGVDSSVVVDLLHRQGHELHLFYIRIGTDNGEGDCSVGGYGDVHSDSPQVRAAAEGRIAP